MVSREHILEAAAQVLAGSPTADVSTRAVCEAAGINAPTLYRHFGDKAGLLAAVVDHGFDQYLASKRAAVPSLDPVQDLRDGWDRHVKFALTHPHYYRLMYSPAVTSTPAAAVEAQSLLEKTLTRCAKAGRLRVSVQQAGQIIMAANVGVALMLVSRPEMFELEISEQAREATHRFVLTSEEPTTTPSTISASAITLAAQLAEQPTPLSANELALLKEWLTKLATPPILE